MRTATATQIRNARSLNDLPAEAEQAQAPTDEATDLRNVNTVVDFLRNAARGQQVPGNVKGVVFEVGGEDVLVTRESILG